MLYRLPRLLRWLPTSLGLEVECIPDRYVKPFVHDHRLLLSSPPRIPEHICGGEGGHMAVTVQMQFTSAVTEMYQDAFVGSAIENGTTIIQFDLRQHDFHSELGTQTKIWWRKEAYHVDVHELSTFHNPITYRFIVAQGSYVNDNDQRMYCTPTIQGVSTSQHMSHSVIWLACYLAWSAELASGTLRCSFPCCS